MPNRAIRILPWLDLAGYRASWLLADATAALSVVFVAIPQGIAYALIAGLPPAAGLYAATFPAIVGSLARSSPWVVTGPTNAVSLIVGSAVAATAGRMGATPVEVGITLAFLVGVIQLGAGLLQVGTFAHYVSTPVLRGYLTGAAVLIVAGQLPNLTGTAAESGTLLTILDGWIRGLGGTRPLDVGVATATVAGIVLLRRLDGRLPGALLALVVGTVASVLFDFDALGVRTAGSLGNMSIGLPPLTLPDFGVLASTLLPAATACAALSLVESSSIARGMSASETRRLDLSTEFAGQGLANLAAAFSGGYPVSGSLARSAVNRRSGARSRLAGAISGVAMLAITWLIGSWVGHVPIASLAGILLVIGFDLLDVRRIGATLRGTWGDAIAFSATLIGTWVLPLDRAILLGIAISVVLFLRRARMLTLRELAVTQAGRFREVAPDLGEEAARCKAIRIANITGPLFFAAVGELEDQLARLASEPGLRVLMVRLRQSQGLDTSVASALAEFAARLRTSGQTMILVGLTPPMRQLLERTGIADAIGAENLFVVDGDWDSAMRPALEHALKLAGPHECGAECPLETYQPSTFA